MRLRSLTAALLFAVTPTLLCSGAAEADKARKRNSRVEECATASEKGQELRDQGKLRAARELFVTCAEATCPSIIKKDCAAWLAAVDEKLPSVAVHARDAKGEDLTEVRLTIDGETVAERLDGRALTLDPGTHTFRFAAAGVKEVERTLLLREGEKARPLDVVLGEEPKKEAPAPKEGRGFQVPTASWVLGAVSLGGFGVLAGLGVSAQLAVEDMRTSCAPYCTEERVDQARRDMILANVGLGVGVLALGAATILTVAHNLSAGKASATLRVHVFAGGAGLSGAW